VIISGAIPELGTSMVETYLYYLPYDVQWGSYYGVDVYSRALQSPRVTSKSWRGWDKFEDIYPSNPENSEKAEI
jgi:hypothetical protein